VKSMYKASVNTLLISYFVKNGTKWPDKQVWMHERTIRPSQWPRQVAAGLRAGEEEPVWKPLLRAFSRRIISSTASLD
jgi:hypothetical protein